MKSATSASSLIDSPKRECKRSFEIEHSNIHDESPFGCTDNSKWLPLLPWHHVADDEHSRSHRPIPQINAEDHMVYRKVDISKILSPGSIRASLADGKIDNKEGVSSAGLKGYSMDYFFNSQIVNHALFAFRPSYSSRATFTINADEHENWPIQVCNADNKYMLEAEISLCTVYVCICVWLNCVLCFVIATAERIDIVRYPPRKVEVRDTIQYHPRRIRNIRHRHLQPWRKVRAPAPPTLPPS